MPTIILDRTWYDRVHDAATELTRAIDGALTTHPPDAFSPVAVAELRRLSNDAYALTTHLELGSEVSNFPATLGPLTGDPDDDLRRIDDEEEDER